MGAIFTQSSIQAQIKENIKGPRLCAGNSPVTGEFPAHMASNAKMFPFDDVIMAIRIVWGDCNCKNKITFLCLVHISEGSATINRFHGRNPDDSSYQELDHCSAEVNWLTHCGLVTP